MQWNTQDFYSMEMQIKILCAVLYLSYWKGLKYWVWTRMGNLHNAGEEHSCYATSCKAKSICALQWRLGKVRKMRMFFNIMRYTWWWNVKVKCSASFLRLRKEIAYRAPAHKGRRVGVSTSCTGKKKVHCRDFKNRTITHEKSVCYLIIICQHF